MADHQEMIHAAASTTGATSHGHGGDWWISTPEQQLPGGFVGAGWSAVHAAADGNSSRPTCGRSGNAAFQEPVGGVTHPSASVVAVPEPAPGLAAGWTQQPYYLDGSGFHGYMSSRNDQGHKIGLIRSPPSNNSLQMLQDPHDQNQQFLSSLGLDLLSSPTTSPSGGFRSSSSLLRTLTEPSAAVARASSSPGFQQYQQQATSQAPGSIREALQFTNGTPFWNNPCTGFAAAVEEGAESFFGSTHGQSRPASLASKRALQGARESSSIVMVKKANIDPSPTPLKKSRTGTPSPVPTFKVRKEKLGDRITALQQLVSPFGKTDTASVLHETIDYIKFLHEQVGSLSAPYLKNRQQQQVPHQKVMRDGGEAAAPENGDLIGRGLCLVPISSTFAVASETPVDFWTPFGAAFR